jgi:hypothetical protein
VSAALLLAVAAVAFSAGALFGAWWAVTRRGLP